MKSPRRFYEKGNKWARTFSVPERNRRLRPRVDYEAWALAMCTLLDRIEQAADSADDVRGLCQQRFAIAKQHGLTVQFLGEPGSGVEH